MQSIVQQPSRQTQGSVNEGFLKGNPLQKLKFK
jgi:hypothetical protein